MKTLKGKITDTWHLPRDTWYLPEFGDVLYKGEIYLWIITNENKEHFQHNTYYLIQYIEYCGDSIIYEESHTTHDNKKVARIIKKLQNDYNILV